MPDPVDSLDAPIDWRDPALWPILSDLQGNILKGHGRDHTQNIFLRFDQCRVADVRRAIRSLAANLTSALTQLREASVFRIVGRPGGTAVYLAISAAGYRAIRLTPPGNPAFLDGMAARAGDLHDPDETEWEDHLRGIHAMLIVADDSDILVGNAAALLTAGLASAGITVLGRDAGRAVRRARPACAGRSEAIGHFGYIDGRSQPLLLAEDVAIERARDGSFQWDPGFSPRHCALVRDPHGGFSDSFGSYLIYRKLERNAVSFQLCDDALVGMSGPVRGDRRSDGAMVVGQFEYGSMPTGARAAGATPDFAYAAVAPGLRWSLPTNVRIADPVGDPNRKAGSSTQIERSRPMPRRGIPYGKCEQGGPAMASGAGLLFMAYNADIGRQFEFTQKSWVADPACAADACACTPGTGSDARSSRTGKGTPKGDSADFAFADFVTLKGGEYLFAPSLSALAAL